MADINNFFYLNRAQYDSITPDTNTVYFVLESSEAANDLVSLYTGAAKQTDLMDISHILESNSIENLSNNTAATIPDSLKIPNKLFLVKNPNIIDENSEGAYEAYMYDSSIQPNGAFLKVFGTPNHIIVCNDGLPSVEDALEGYLYVLQQDGVKKNTYIFDGSNYSEIIDLSDFLTIENISQYISQPDNITILKNQNNELHGVGADMSGKSVISGQTEIIVGDGASIFNDYSNNVCIGEYSNVFGKNNAERAVDSNAAKTNACNTIFGKNNSINSNAEDNFVCGNGQMIACTNASCNTLLGNNTLVGGTVNNNFIFGNNGNTSASQSPLAASSIKNCFIGGKANSVTASLDTAFMFGESNSVSGTGGSNIIFMFGYGNSFTSSTSKSVEGCVVIGTGNTVQSTNYYQHNGGCLVCGDGLQLQAQPGRTFLGSYNDTTTFVDNDPRVFCIGIGSSANREDGLRLLSNGILHVCASNGNVVTENGIKLSSTRTTDSTILADDSAYTFSILPNNGSEIILSNFYTIGDITITSTSDMTYESINQYGQWSSLSKPTSDDYNSVIIFKKSSTKTTASDLIENFTDSNLPRIYLLNPDIDISNFTIIHIMLFNDGFNICAIVAGYDDGPANI